MRKRLAWIAYSCRPTPPRLHYGRLFWTLEPNVGRVFMSIPGHFAWTFDDPLFRILLLRGIAWTAKHPVDRFNPLATPGARLKD